MTGLEGSVVQQGALDPLSLGGGILWLRLGITLQHALPHQLLLDDARVLGVRVGHLALESTGRAGQFLVPGTICGWSRYVSVSAFGTLRSGETSQFFLTDRRAWYPRPSPRGRT